jgi:predicted RNase H-like nuclease
MAGGWLFESKATWAGVERRQELLAAANNRLAGDLGTTGRMARVDDVLDAAAAAWSARGVAAGDAVPLPNPPETYSDGLPCAIWV